MTTYQGTAIVEKDYEVDAKDENEARIMICDLAEAEYPEADIYLVKEVFDIG